MTLYQDYLEKCKKTLEFIEKHESLLYKDSRLLKQEMKELDAKFGEFVIPSRLDVEIYEDLKDSKYIMLSVRRDVALRFEYKLKDIVKERVDVIVKFEDFEKIKELDDLYERYSKFESYSGTFFGRYSYSLMKKDSQKEHDIESGAIDDSLEEQVRDYVNSRPREYFVNRAVKDVRKDFLVFSSAKVGAFAYRNRRVKNSRLSAVLRQLYDLKSKKILMSSDNQLQTYIAEDNRLGTLNDYYVEV